MNHLHPETTRATPPPRLALDVREAAEALGVSENTLRLLTDERGLPVVRVGRRCLYPVAALSRWLDRQAEEGGAP